MDHASKPKLTANSIIATMKIGMKGLLRNTLINAFALFLISQVVYGLEIKGGFLTYFFGGLALALLFKLLKPILKLISLPLNALTLGFFSFVVNAIIFYLLTVFIPSISISGFTFSGISYAGFTIPKVAVNTFFAFIVIAILQSLIFNFTEWVMKK